MNDCAIYARYSSDHQGYESIDAQLRFCYEFANKKGLRVVGTYIDEAVTGTKDSRDSFQRMISDSKLKLFSYVIAHKVDRFARDEYDHHFYKRKFKSNGVDVLFAAQDFGTGPEAALMENMLVGVSAYYSRNLSTEVMKGMKENAYSCKFNGGRVLFGYDVDENNLFVVNHHESVAVKYIFESYIRGDKYSSILSWLSLNGYVTKEGKPFKICTIREIIKNEKFVGVYSFNVADKHRRKKTIEEVIVVKDGMPPIVSIEEFQQAKSRMDAGRHKAGANHAKEHYLLSGKLKCECGYSMVGNRRTGGKNKNSVYVSYRCTGHKQLGSSFCDQRDIPRAVLEEVVLERIEELFKEDDKLVDYIYNQYVEYISKSKSSSVAYKEELKKINAEIDNIVNAIAAGMFHISMKNKMDVLEDKKNQLIHKIADEDIRRTYVYTKEQVMEFLNLGKDVSARTYEEKKIIIDTYVKEIVVKKEKIDVYVYLSNIVVNDSSGGPLVIVATILLPFSSKRKEGI